MGAGFIAMKKGVGAARLLQPPIFHACLRVCTAYLSTVSPGEIRNRYTEPYSYHVYDYHGYDSIIQGIVV